MTFLPLLDSVGTYDNTTSHYESVVCQSDLLPNPVELVESCCSHEEINTKQVVVDRDDHH